MTQIYIEPCRIRIEGHANAPRSAQGNDLVCAAVSALACTLAELVASKQEQLEEKAAITLLPGHVYIACKPKPQHRHDMELLFSFFACGAEKLQAEYGENVRVIQLSNGG